MSKNMLVIISIILFIVVLGLSGYIIYNNTNSFNDSSITNKDIEKEENNNIDVEINIEEIFNLLDNFYLKHILYLNIQSKQSFQDYIKSLDNNYLLALAGIDENMKFSELESNLSNIFW